MKLIQYLAISGISLVVIWYVLFSNWGMFNYMNSLGNRASRFWAYPIAWLPVSAMVFGRMTAIFGLGAWRAVSRRAFRKFAS